MPAERSADPTSVYPSYWDASALVKVYVDEADDATARVRDHFNRQQRPAYTTTYCFGEAINIVKAKRLKKKLTSEQYLDTVVHMLTDRAGGMFEPVDYGTLLTAFEVKKLAARYPELDAVDVLQLLTLQDGLHSRFIDGSTPLLITADRGLAEAARSEQMRVWYCIDEPTPPLKW